MDDNTKPEPSKGPRPQLLAQLRVLIERLTRRDAFHNLHHLRWRVAWRNLYEQMHMVRPQLPSRRFPTRIPLLSVAISVQHIPPHRLSISSCDTLASIQNGTSDRRLHVLFV